MFYISGRDMFWETDCIFVENQNGLNLYPIEDKGITTVYKHIYDIDFLLNYQSQIYTNTIISIHKVHSDHNRGFELTANYIIKRIDKKPIAKMIITSDAIDSLFSTVRYYYDQRCAGINPSANLLYESEEVETWNINYKGKIISVTLMYGEVLKRGIWSDTKIHPKLKLSFPETTDSSYLYEIYSIIRFFLQVSMYGYNIGKTEVELFTSSNASYGYLYDYSHKRDECTFSNIKYSIIKTHIQDLLQFAADNYTMQIDFFPQDFRGLFDDSINGLLFASLYAGFESECNKNVQLYQPADDSPFREQKNEIIQFIREKRQSDTKDMEKFYQDIETRINQYGTEVGQSRKIINAYNALSDALQSSMQNIFLTLPDKKADFPNKQEIKKIANFLLNLRGKVIHRYEKNVFSIEEQQYVQFLEILLYSMILKRAGVSNKGIEHMIGSAFSCNFSYMDDENK